MKRIATILFTLLTPNAFGQMLTLDKVFQAHAPDGMAYWVVTCMQADECLEDAYKWCDGPYKGEIPIHCLT